VASSNELPEEERIGHQASDHAKRVAEFAMAAVNAAKSVLIDPDNAELGFVQICVGFHAGPVLSNVIGSHTRRYALFGDTVNVARRIASTSKPGLVLCSDSAN
jgi:class 3 adenylate cyclase